MTHALSCLPETEIAACNGGPGMYGEWTNWSVGSQECPGGISRRFQYHDCGSEPIIGERTFDTDSQTLVKMQFNLYRHQI